jgi:alkylated DNA repair dioxygenase AlkB
LATSFRVPSRANVGISTRSNVCSSAATIGGMELAFQPTLLDNGSDIGCPPVAAGVERILLSRGAWVDLHRNWVEGSDLLFERLVEGVPWRAERRQMYDRIVDVPRLVAFYDEGDPLPDPALASIRSCLSAHYQGELGEPFRSVGLCLYRNGTDSVAWHGDRIGRSRTEDTMVAIVSLGTPRRFLLRPRGGGRSQRFELGRGDLFVMGGSCQRTWEHSVPKLAHCDGPRVSAQFRPAGVR